MQHKNLKINIDIEHSMKENGAQKYLTGLQTEALAGTQQNM
jgi:hypothetical protein